MMILPVNTSTVLLTCKILQIYFDKLKLTSHNCYDGLLNTSEASSVHCDGRKMKYYFPRCALPGTGLEREGWLYHDAMEKGGWEGTKLQKGSHPCHTAPLRTDKKPGKGRYQSVVM